MKLKGYSALSLILYPLQNPIENNAYEIMPSKACMKYTWLDSELNRIIYCLMLKFVEPFRVLFVRISAPPQVFTCGYSS